MALKTVMLSDKQKAAVPRLGKAGLGLKAAGERPGQASLGTEQGGSNSGHPGGSG